MIFQIMLLATVFNVYYAVHTQNKQATVAWLACFMLLLNKLIGV